MSDSGEKMTDLDRYLAKYAAYHRDPRNIATHFVGIPMIVFSVFVLLQKPGFSFAGYLLTPALLVYLASTVFYLRLSLIYGMVMAVAHGLLLVLAQSFSQADLVLWASVGVGVFIVGWIIQFVGHYYEGRKPAFVDDISGLAIGPLFVVAEFGFLIGLGKKHEAEVIRVTGPVRKQSNAT